jgi:hypothetical protein
MSVATVAPALVGRSRPVCDTSRKPILGSRGDGNRTDAGVPARSRQALAASEREPTDALIKQMWQCQHEASFARQQRETVEWVSEDAHLCASQGWM